MGQWEGWRKKIPVQLHRRPQEARCACLLRSDAGGSVCSCLSESYDRLLGLNQDDIFRFGEWSAMHEPHVPGVAIWEWFYGGKKALVLVSYQDQEVALDLNLPGWDGPVIDMLSGRRFQFEDLRALAPWGVVVCQAGT